MSEMMKDLQGWDGLDLNNPAYEKLRAAQAAQMDSVKRDMKECFGDEVGQRVLGYLLDWTLLHPAVDPNESDKMTAFKGGQEFIVRSILFAVHDGE